MKTLKIVCIMALVILIAKISNAQSVSTKDILWFPYAIPIECDGVQDILIAEDGTVPIHIVEFSDKSGFKWHKNQVHAAVKSQSTGEIFKVHEINKGDFHDGIWTFHYNMIGNMGTHIQIRGKAFLPEFEVFELEITCK